MSSNPWDVVSEYVNSLSGLKPLLVIMHGLWVTGEAFLMESKPPVDLIIIADNAPVGVREDEVKGLRIKARFLTPESALSMVEQCDEELINAIYTGTFIVKDEEFYKRIENALNEQIREGRLTWDSKRGLWVKASLI
ncbi:hypothetical protein [Caldivirga maquilingensis]|uniref:Uncharacterized protein n=1 Tax=Caldivirga maquilingensis (strain ATCC 700844 / DSM 13496 / JCM 10307 / IC-167) TaxID=397948 RepID=A8MC11_CALMQ|nr:hypothetical protein [Caldivirga maquilingensis]ABW02795.1 hypothetical protein Cmaq_1979 [Caldivirga maquilingensis IC-167]